MGGYARVKHFRELTSSVTNDGNETPVVIFIASESGSAILAGNGLVGAGGEILSIPTLAGTYGLHIWHFHF